MADEEREPAANADEAPDGLLTGSTELPDPRASMRSDGTPEGRLLFHQVKGRLFGDTDDEDPVRIGRFVVIKRIGQGGMGLIYAAYDDTLDRKVAVKLLRPERAGTGSDGHNRLMREAQALARLSHPNVIQVYEVDAFQDQVYVAMEYVDGRTLEAWQANRDWREIVRTYLEAGRGLAAAHDAGIVHRDFKAENVLVRGEDRAVRVLDFGLARTEFEPGDSDVEELRRLAEHAVDVPLTHTGVIMGTPAYMAPEQHTGKATDPRTDQFSFCVSLWEALYGFRPFAGNTLHELRINVLDGAVEPAPRFTDVPAPIHRALLRGLSVAPNGRYPTMDALLLELAEPTGAGRWTWLAAGSVTLALALGVGTWWSAAADRQVRQEGTRLRAEFERARVIEAEEELRRLRSRTVGEKWNEVVLTYAQLHARDAPTEALAALKHLAPGADGWLDAARTVATDAVRRGPIFRELPPALGDGAHELRFSTDGLELAALADDGRILRWDLQTGQYDFVQPKAKPGPKAKNGPPAKYEHITFDRIGRLVASDDQGRLHRWTPPETVDIVELGDLSITALTAGFRGQIAVGDASGAIHVIDEVNFDSRHVLRNHEGPIRGLDFSPNALELASASQDGTIKLWDLSQGVHRTFRAGLSATHCRFLDHGRFLAGRTGNGTIHVWATDDGRRVTNRGAVGTMFDGSAGSGVLILDDPDEGLAVQYPEDNDPRSLHRRGSKAFAVAVDPTGRWGAASTDAGLVAWRIGKDDKGMRPGGDIPLLASRDGSVSAMAFSPDGSLVWGTRWGVVRRWDTDGSSAELIDLEGAILHLAVADDGRWVAIDDEAGRVRLVPLAGGKAKLLPTARYPIPGPMIWSPDGGMVARLACTAPVSCAVDLFPIDGGDPSRLDVSSKTREIRFSPDAQTLVVEAQDSVSLWRNGEDPVEVQWPAEATLRRLAFAYTPEGALRIATTDGAKTGGRVRQARLDVWQVGKRPDRVHALFSEPVLEVIVASDDHRSLLLRTTEGRNLLWRLEEDRFHMLPDDLGEVTRMLVSPDGAAVLVVSSQESDAWVVDVDSGHARSLPPVFGLVAWSPDGALAIAGQGARKWTDPTPDRPQDFLEWLGVTTSVAIGSDAMR